MTCKRRSKNGCAHPLAQETLHLEQARVRAQWQKEHGALEECLIRLDECIVTCMDRINEYQKRHTELTRLNQRLTTLGAEPELLPGSLIASNIDATIRSRLGALHRQGKL